jgi:hypothetical protein
MADLAKLASLSKRLKTSPAKQHEDKSVLTGAPTPSITEGVSDDSPAIGNHSGGGNSAPAAAPSVIASAPQAVGAAPKVTVNLDLGPVTDMLGRIRDEMRNLREEIKKTREKGMKVELGDESTEQLDQVLKHLSSVSKASRELTEKLVTSLPESRWYGDVLNLGREMGSAIAQGGGGGGGAAGSSEDIDSIKEQLEMQKTQLTAILSILQRR